MENIAIYWSKILRQIDLASKVRFMPVVCKMQPYIGPQITNQFVVQFVV